MVPILARGVDSFVLQKCCSFTCAAARHGNDSESAAVAGIVAGPAEAKFASRSFDPTSAVLTVQKVPGHIGRPSGDCGGLFRNAPGRPSFRIIRLA